MSLRGDAVPAATSYIIVRLLRAKALAMTGGKMSLRATEGSAAIMSLRGA